MDTQTTPRGNKPIELFFMSATGFVAGVVVVVLFWTWFFWGILALGLSLCLWAVLAYGEWRSDGSDETNDEAREETADDAVEDELCGFAEFPQLLDELPQGVAMSRLGNGHGYCNRVFTEWLGYTASDLVAMGGILGAVVDKHQAQEMSQTSRQGHMWVGEVEFLKATGEVTSRETRFFELRGEDRQVRAHFVLLCEESEKSTRETQFQRLRDRLRAAEQTETAGVITQGVAHEFNNTLQTICGFTQCVMEKLSEQDRSYQDLQSVCQAVEHATLLTRQLLATSRRSSIRLMDVQMNAMIRDHVKIARPLIGEQIDISLDLADDVGTHQVDPADLEQALLALSLNARDAMPDGGHLKIRSRCVEFDAADLLDVKRAKPGLYTSIVFEDNGGGMDPETLREAYEAFSPSDTEQQQVGLGLAGVRRALSRYGGFMRISSRVGEGTTVELCYPTSLATEKRAPEETPAAHRECILVAEDDGMLLALARRILQEAGYDVIVAHDGEEAVQQFEENKDRISLVLTDVVMPRLTGREVYERVVQLKPECKVIFASGYDPIASHVGFISQRSLPLLTKPFRPQDLLLAIRQVLHGERTWSAV